MTEELWMAQLARLDKMDYSLVGVEVTIYGLSKK